VWQRAHTEDRPTQPVAKQLCTAVLLRMSRRVATVMMWRVLTDLWRVFLCSSTALPSTPTSKLPTHRPPKLNNRRKKTNAVFQGGLVPAA
jgi:hypothetical protein